MKIYFYIAQRLQECHILKCNTSIEIERCFYLSFLTLSCDHRCNSDYCDYFTSGVYFQLETPQQRLTLNFHLKQFYRVTMFFKSGSDRKQIETSKNIYIFMSSYSSNFIYLSSQKAKSKNPVSMNTRCRFSELIF